jgi:DNA-binding transcriptional regulator YiaG
MSSLVAEMRRRPRSLPPQVAAAIRDAAGISQVRLAEELHVHRVTLARWEAGTHRPRRASHDAWMDLIAELRAALEDGGS